MTSIERTAYPRFSKRQQFSQQWLYNTFTLQDSDHEILQRKRTINDTYKLCMAIQLKTFQYLGYFIDLKDVPGAVVKTIRDSLGFPSTVKTVYHHNRTKYRHRNYIRSKLAIVKWKSMPFDQQKGTRRLAIAFAYNISTTMNNPADIINATLEFMVSDVSTLIRTHN